jgi:hypothetical protein
MAATDNRQYDARELASAGMAVASPGGFGLVAATLQRARINGAIGDGASTMLDLRAGERDLAAAGEARFPTTTTRSTRPRPLLRLGRLGPTPAAG